MSSHDSTDVSSTDLSDRIAAGERTELAQPITVHFRGTARQKITGHCLDFDNERSDLFVEAADRLKTRLKMRTAEEATAVLEELSRYGAGRSWMTATMAETVLRVQREVAEALRERDFVVEESDRGLWTVLDREPDAGAQPVAMADGGHVEEFTVPDHFVLTLPSDTFESLEVRPDGALRIQQTADQREEFLEFVSEETSNVGESE